MAQKLRPQTETLYGLPQPLQTGLYPPVIARRDPTSEDTGYPIGQNWVNKVDNNYWVLTSVSGGFANWEASAGPGLYPITPYVVGPTGEAGYQTIQSAVDAATENGGGIVYIQPGSYTENVALSASVNLCGLLGACGNLPATVGGTGTDTGVIPPVFINGTLTLDLSDAQDTVNSEIRNITFTPPSGDLFTWIGNPNLFENGWILFYGCIFNVAASAALFNINGFFNINFDSCVVQEQTPDTATIVTFPDTDNAFLNWSCRDSTIDINSVNPCEMPLKSYVLFDMQNCAYSARVDASLVDPTDAPAFFLTLYSCFVSFEGVSSGDSLVLLGANSGSVIAQNSQMGDISGSLADCTGSDPTNIFTYTGCVFQNSLIMSSNARGDFSSCKLTGGSSAALVMNSSQNISLKNCVLDSSNNPCISGNGAGTLTLNGISFADNSNIAGTVTLSYGTNSFGTLKTSNSAISISSGTGAISISADAAATAVNVGTGAGAKTVTVGSTNTTSATNLTAGSGGVNCATDFALTSVATKILMNGGAATDFIGTATLTNGTVTVNNTNIAAADRILAVHGAINASTAIGTLTSTISAGASFVVTSRKADSTTETGDQSTISYVIFRQT